MTEEGLIYLQPPPRMLPSSKRKFADLRGHEDYEGAPWATQTLDILPSAVLVVECTLNTISPFTYAVQYTNNALRELCGTNEPWRADGQINSIPFLTDSSNDHFASALVKCAHTGKSTSKRFKLAGTRLPVWVTFTPLPPLPKQNKLNVCCLFDCAPDAAMKEERYKWLDAIDKLADAPAVALEYHEDIDDFKTLFLAASCREDEFCQRHMKKAIEDQHPTECVCEDCNRTSMGLRHLLVYNECGVPREPGVSWHKAALETIATGEDRPTERALVMPGQSEPILFSGVVKSLGRDVVTGRPRVLALWKDNSVMKRTQLEVDTLKQNLMNALGEYETMKTLVQNAPIMMAIFEIEAVDEVRYIFANEEVTRRFGAPGSISGKSCKELGVPLEDRLYVISEFEKSRETGTHQFSLKRVLGKTKFHDTCLVKHLGGNKFIYVLQDVSALHKVHKELRKHQEQLESLVQARTDQLEQALNVKTRFLATMSHEMRTPLSGVLGVLQLLADSTLNGEQRSLVRSARMCGEQLLSIINDVLDMSKIEENKVSLEQCPFSLLDVLEDSLQVASFYCVEREKNLELVLDADPQQMEACVVVGDACRLRQVIVNLLSNAIKFSPSNEGTKGEVVLTARCKREGDVCLAEFSVTDRGIGIPESAKASLFQAFVQGDSSVSRRYGGSGLGLCISKRLAQLMGGDMWFESQEGVGSTFWFSIRATEAPESGSAAYSCNNLTALLRKSCREKAAVVVGGTETLRRCMKRHLLAFGLRSVDLVTDAWALLEDGLAPHVVFADSGVGTESIQRLAEGQKTRPTPYVLVVMSSTPLKGVEGLRTLKKPFSMASIGHVLVEICAGTSPPDSTATAIFPRLPRPALRAQPEILVAEDNAMNQLVIRKFLESAGYRKITFVENGREAVQAATTRKFDLILMDVMMPEMDGLEATRRIRTHFKARAGGPVVVAITANAFAEDRQQCMEAGMNHVLTKPINRDALTDLVAKATDHDATGDPMVH